MGTDTEVLRHVNLIRSGARAASRLPFGGSAIVEGCLWVELAGMPRRYRLTSTARDYAELQDAEYVAAALAAQLGNPLVPPAPPLWPVLALLLLAWRDTLISVRRIMQRAVTLGLENEVRRGLVIVAHLFPELQDWLVEISVKIPLWERTLAVPLAARKLAQLEKMDYWEWRGLPDLIPPGYMQESVGSVRWRVTGGSQRGARHVRLNLKNQDAIRYVASGEPAMVVLAIADGHGSDLAFRSDAGSRLAVEAATALLGRFAKTVGIDGSATAIHEQAGALGDELTRAWRTAVLHHLDEKPFTSSEWRNLAALEGWQGQNAIKSRPELAYGSTILSVLATETYVMCLQLGDGDILFVDSVGHTTRAMPERDRRPGKHVPSLCRRNAAKHVEILVRHASSEKLPTLILAGTDGYAECYESDEELLRGGGNYFRMVRTEGFDRLDKRLRRLLDEASESGSGDDITIGLVSRIDRPPAPKLEHRRRDLTVETSR